MLRYRWILAFSLLTLGGLLVGSSFAGDCEQCESMGFASSYTICKPVDPEGVGSEKCEAFVANMGGGSVCIEPEPFCSDITVTPGGSGGGGGFGGGSSNPCATNFYCPVQCFTCSSSPMPAK